MPHKWRELLEVFEINVPRPLSDPLTIHLKNIGVYLGFTLMGAYFVHEDLKAEGHACVLAG